MSFGYSVLALDFSILILLAACSDDSERQGWVTFLRLPWMRRIGKYSYAMYLLHVPLHILVGQALLRALGLDRQPSLLVNVVYLLLGTALSYVAGAVSFRMLESRFLRLKDRFEPAQGAHPTA
jgi:peptidoglycan/LPS O-acetylase OafA/YrhL